MTSPGITSEDNLLLKQLGAIPIYQSSKGPARSINSAI